MEKTTKTLAAALCMAAALTATMAAQAPDGVMERQADGTYVVNTTKLCADVKGYRAATPLKIYIKNDKVTHVEALKNQESPKYFSRVKQQVLGRWDGKAVKKAAKMKVDGVTGATLSSDAVKQNVRKGLEYYQKNK